MGFLNVIGRSLLVAVLTACLFSNVSLAQDAPLEVSLKCTGSGTSKDTETTTTTTRNRKEDSKEVGTQRTSVEHPFDGIVFLEISGEEAKVKLPLGMLPSLQKDDAGKWFEVQDLSIDSEAVKGKVRINFLNKPDMTLDRTTGTIVMANSFNNFAGQCEVYDKEAQRLF